MKRLIILISLIVAFEAADPGFRLDALKILGGNNRLNSELNYNGLNNYGLNSGFDRGNMMGMILGGNSMNQNSMNQNSMNPNNENNKNQFPQLLPMPNLPFTDGLNYNPQSVIPQPQMLPIPQEDYKKEDLNYGRILAPGRLAPLPNLPDLPNILPSKEESLGLAPSFTANAKDSRSQSTFDFKQPLFNAPLAPNNNMNNNMNNMNMNTNNNINTNTNNYMSNNNMNNMNNNLQLNGNFNNFQMASSGLAVDKVPVEVSQFSTQITHDVPRLQIQPPTTLSSYGKAMV